MKTRYLAVPLLLSIAASTGACAGDDTSESDPPPASTPCDSAIPGAPRVAAAFPARIAAASGAPGLLTIRGPDGTTIEQRAQAAIDTPEAEARRTAIGGDYLVRGYLAPFVESAGIADGDWLDTLSDSELTPAEIWRAGELAQHLVQRQLDARGAPSPWVGAYLARETERLDAVHVVPGAPAGWYGSLPVFAASWDAALLVGYDAGDDAYAAATAAGDSAEVAAAKARDAVVNDPTNVRTFTEIGATSFAKADELISIR